MTQTHTIALNDVCDNGKIIRGVTLDEAFALIGPCYPVKVDRIPGHLDWTEDFMRVVFKPHDINETITTD